MENPFRPFHFNELYLDVRAKGLLFFNTLDPTGYRLVALPGPPTALKGRETTNKTVVFVQF
jgi:hypothetical protein